MQKILLAGATGNLGPHLAKALIAKQKNVYALVRPESFTNPDKVNPLKELGVHLVGGDLNDHESLTRACQGMDAVISALGGGQILQQEVLLTAAKAAEVKRFIPSEFGVDPFAADRGTCDLFDAKVKFQNMIRNSGVDYTMIYTNGFMEFWASGLGQLGNDLTKGSVDYFGEGNVKASMIGLPDLARFTVEILDDPEMANREVRFSANEMSQEDLIRTWEQVTESVVKRNPVTDQQLTEIIERANTPDQMMTRIFTQLHRSVWIKGDTMKKRTGTVEATERYPDLPVESVKTFFSKMYEPAH